MSIIKLNINETTTTDSRIINMVQWLDSSSVLQSSFSFPKPASNDASFRRYFRIKSQSNKQLTYIVMDAPPQKEDCKTFIKVAEHLINLGIKAPKIIDKNLEQGFILLEDFGNLTYFKALKGNKTNHNHIDKLYHSALYTLVELQVKTKTDIGQKFKNSLPLYDAQQLQDEMNIFTEWFLNRHLKIKLNTLENLNWKKTCDFLIKNAMHKSDTYVLRDYHSRNIMLLDDKNISIGILDFQDACKGALTYDAVSLLRDCYLSWPEEQVEDWQKYFFMELVQKNIISNNEWNDFQKNMDLMGIQRHLKATGIFSRLYHKDNKPDYLKDIPNTLNHIINVGKKYTETKDLVMLIEQKILPRLSESN